MRSASGCIVRLGKDRWRVYVQGGKDPDTGKRTRPSKIVRGSRRDAERVKAEMLIEAGEPVDSKLTVREYGDTHYLPAKRDDLKQSSAEAYQMRLEHYVYPALGDTRLKDLEPQAIRAWLRTFDKPTVRREAYRALRGLCQFAVYDDHLKENPLDRVRPPKVDRYEPEVLDLEEIDEYLKLFRGSTVEAGVLLAIGCGLRRGEICALNVDDIDPETGAVRIDDSYLSLKTGATESTPKSANGYRTVHMPAFLLRRLLEILPNSGPVLPGKSGRMHPDSLTHTYERKLKHLPDGVKRIPFKNLRHTSLTLAFDSGSDLYDVSKRAGHSNMAITSRYYVRPKTSKDEEIAEAMDEALRAPSCAKSENVVTLRVDYSEAICF